MKLKKPKKTKSKEITTIKINKKTKSRLDRLKEHERETYDQVLQKILFILNLSKSNPEKAQRIFKKLDSLIKRKEEYEEEDIDK
jgi:hypothetical protein